MERYTFHIIDLADEQMQISRTQTPGSIELTITGPESPTVPLGETLSRCEFAAAMDKLQEKGFDVIVGPELQTVGLVGPQKMPATKSNLRSKGALRDAPAA